jgi:hypothetical protein
MESGSGTRGKANAATAKMCVTMSVAEKQIFALSGLAQGLM